MTQVHFVEVGPVSIVIFLDQFHLVYRTAEGAIGDAIHDGKTWIMSVPFGGGTVASVPRGLQVLRSRPNMGDHDTLTLQARSPGFSAVTEFIYWTGPQPGWTSSPPYATATAGPWPLLTEGLTQGVFDVRSFLTRGSSVFVGFTFDMGQTPAGEISVANDYHGQNHVWFRTQDGRIWNAFGYHDAKGAESVTREAATLVPDRPLAAGDPTVWVDSAGTMRVAYVTQSGELYQLFYSNAGGWQGVNVSAKVKPPWTNPLQGTPSIAEYAGQIHVVVRDSANNIMDFLLDNGTWTLQQIPTKGNVANDDPTAAVWPRFNQFHVMFPKGLGIVGHAWYEPDSWGYEELPCFVSP